MTEEEREAYLALQSRTMVLKDGMRLPTVRDIATVTVAEPVDGTSRRRRACGPRRPAQKVARTIVNRMVWEAAKEHCGLYERIIIVSESEVRIVNKKEQHA